MGLMLLIICTKTFEVGQNAYFILDIWSRFWSSNGEIQRRIDPNSKTRDMVGFLISFCADLSRNNLSSR